MEVRNMQRNRMIILLVGLFLLGFNYISIARQDAKNCGDLPFFSRMPNFYIYECKTTDFDSYDFYEPATKGEKKVTVEGKKYYVDYYVEDQYFDNRPSNLQIIRNYENVIKNSGGKTYSYKSSSKGYLYANYEKDGKEIWVEIDAYDGRTYSITVIEKGGMKQEVIVDARKMASDIKTSGKVAIYGIYFDFNKSDIKPESEPILQQIAELLRDNPKLKLYVVGHTDDVGGFDYNMKLSQARAQAVVKELTTK